MIGKKKLIEYGVYDLEGNLVDVIFFTAKDAKKYEQDNPEYTLEEYDEEVDDE